MAGPKYTSPIKTAVEEGKAYFWCRCGQSDNQPWCDGSHKGTEFTPLRWQSDFSGEKFFCRCKQTGNTPFCDGTHKTVGG